MRTRLAASLASLLLALLPAAALAGPLDPPAGPIAPSMKTLQQVEPRIPIGPDTTPGVDEGPLSSVYAISQPGSYYLTHTIAGQPGKVAIWIRSSGVTLDMGGFGITGGYVGILAGTLSGPVRQVVVHSGFVRDCEELGVSLSGAEGGRLEDFSASGCGGTGLRIGVGGVMSGCTSIGNWRGFDADAPSTVLHCHARSNQQEGFNTVGGVGVVFIGCTSSANARIGFSAFGAVLTDCTAADNGEHGMNLLGGSRATGCRSSGNTLSGFNAASETILDRCVAVENGTFGIEATQGCRIEGCTVGHNAGDGIRVTDSCEVVGNIARNNGVAVGLTGAGIRCMGPGNRIENNQVVYNEVGIGVAAGVTDNFIVRNIARGNTVSGITAPAGNELAPVISNPGSNAFSTATPWSNFVY